MARLTGTQRRLAVDHIGMARGIAQVIARHWPPYTDRADVVAAATLGLVQAAQRYDPASGVPFNRFAFRRIRGAAADSLRTDNWAPRYTWDRLTLDERERSWPLSLDAPSHTDKRRDDTETLGDIIVDDIDTTEAFDEAELVAYLHDAIRLLPPRQREVVVAYYFDGDTLDTIGAALGITGSAVCYRIRDALVLLRHGLAAQYDQPAAVPLNPIVARRRARYAADIARAHRNAA